MRLRVLLLFCFVLLVQPVIGLAQPVPELCRYGGGRIVVMVQTGEEAGYDALDPVSGARERLYTAPPAEMLLSGELSPDGTRLAFVANGSSGHRLYLLTLGEDTPQPLITAHSEQVQMDWSPDGRRLAFIGVYEDRTAELLVATLPEDPNTEPEIRVLLDSRVVRPSGPDWSPDGTRLVFNGISGQDEGIYVVDVDSGSLRKISQQPGNYLRVVWSPDGETFAFHGWLGGDFAFDLFTLSADGTHLQPITDFGAAYYPAWSPNGEQIAFMSDRPLPGSASVQMDLWLINRDGSGEVNLTSTADTDEKYPAWQPCLPASD